MFDSSLEELKSHPKVLDLYLSRLRLKKESSTRYRGTCPFHSENTPSFDVFQHQNRWIHKCLGCGAAGSVLDLIQKTDSVPFKEAVRITREFCSEWASAKPQVESVFKSVGENETKKFRTFSEQEYQKLEQSLANNKAAQAWLLDARGISLETAKRLRLGYRQDVGKLCGDSNSEVADKGWIAFPTFDRGNISSIKYRSVAAKIFCKQPGMKTELFNTETLDFLEPVFLVEGEFDACALEQAGFKAVSLPNAQYNPTPSDKDLLLQAECVILAGDNDGAAGTKIMDRLWADMKERTYKLVWPVNCKDANQFFLEECKKEISVFRARIHQLVAQAKSNPIPNVYDLKASMMSSNRTNLADHPLRMRFPWPSVDSMVILLPGSILSLFATQTKMGKTCFTMNASLHAARKHGEVVLNYQCELSPDEFSNMVAAHVLRKSRNSINKEDYQKAAQLLDCKYYIGNNPTLTTVDPVLDLIESAIRRLGATTVILDHIHFICRNSDNEVTAQANAMQRIKRMAQAYQVKFIVVGQPRKSNQQSKGKMVHITDAKGSETYTSDADAVIAIHRNVMANKDEFTKEDFDPMTEVHVLGARAKGDGSTFAKIMFVGELATFSEVAYDQEPTGLFTNA